MQRVELASGSQISRLVYGMWRLGDDSDSSDKHVQAKIEACLSQGIDTFDQADIYGNYTCEKILGRTLKAAPSLRAQMQIITKCDILLLSDKYPDRKVKHYDTSPSHIRSSVELSLSNMEIEQIDGLLLHRPDPLMNHHETGAALDDLVETGKVRWVGASNFMKHDWTLLQSAMNTPLATNQIEISLLQSGCLTDGSVAFMQEHGIKPMAWSPLAGGYLFAKPEGGATLLQQTLAKLAGEQGVAVDAIAVAWLLKHPANIIPVLGTNNLQRIKALSDACKVELTREDWFVLYECANGHEVA